MKSESRTGRVAKVLGFVSMRADLNYQQGLVRSASRCGSSHPAAVELDAGVGSHSTFPALEPDLSSTELVAPTWNSGLGPVGTIGADTPNGSFTATPFCGQGRHDVK